MKSLETKCEKLKFEIVLKFWIDSLSDHMSAPNRNAFELMYFVLQMGWLFRSFKMQIAK